MSTRRLHAPTTDCRFFDGAPKSFDAETRTCDAILSTGSEVKRFYGRERLRIDEKSVDFSRVRAGQVALLDSHNQSSIINALGKVPIARVAGGAVVGKLVFNQTAEGKRAMGMVQRGEVSGISCGYLVSDWEISNDDGEILDPDKDRIRWDDDLIYTATRWAIHEVSLVSVPADSTARVRSLAGNRSFRDLAVPATDEVRMRLARLEAGMPASPESIRNTRARILAGQRMTERSCKWLTSEEDDDTVDQLLALRRMDDADRWKALHLLSDSEVSRVLELMEADDEIAARLLEEDDATCLSVLQQVSDQDRWRILYAIPDRDIERLFG